MNFSQPTIHIQLPCRFCNGSGKVHDWKSNGPIPCQYHTETETVTLTRYQLKYWLRTGEIASKEDAEEAEL